MKKRLCLFLSFVLIFGLCGCVEGDLTERLHGEITERTEEQTKGEPKISLGKVTDRTYHNDFLGLSIALPAGWQFYSEEQIMELNNLAVNYMDEDVAERIEQAAIIYDMSAQYFPDGSSVNVNIEKLNPLVLATNSIQQILESQIDMIESTYANMGYTDVSVEYQKTNVDGRELDSVKISAKLQSVDFAGVVLAIRKGDYIANVAVASLRPETMEELLGCVTLR